MTHSEPTIIERSVEKAHIWIGEVASALGTDDRHYAYRALRAVLHTLRDRLTIEEAAQLAAQLPTLIRGIYYEDWNPSRAPAAFHSVKDFLDHIAEEGRLAGETEASYAVTAVATVLRDHVTAGELADVIAILPSHLKPLLEGDHKVRSANV